MLEVLLKEGTPFGLGPLAMLLLLILVSGLVSASIFLVFVAPAIGQTKVDSAFRGGHVFGNLADRVVDFLEPRKNGLDNLFCNNDFFCDFGENESSCPLDCQQIEIAFCGDAKCNNLETPQTCAQDCQINSPCGDGACSGNETPQNCALDCETQLLQHYCGDNVCSGTEACSTCAGDCGACPATCTLNNGSCQNSCDAGNSHFINGDIQCRTGQICCTPNPLPECVTADGACPANCFSSPDPDCIATPACGNGEIESQEQCDQGNNNITSGDGCSSACLTESNWNCSGTPSVCTQTVLSNTVTGLTLVNADSDQDIAAMTDGFMVNTGTTETSLNVRADVTSDVTSVRFNLDNGGWTQDEKARPFALFGDNSGNYKPGSFSFGQHTLTATPFAGNTQGTPLTINFTVTSDPSPPIANAGPDQTVSLPNGQSTMNVTLDGSASFDPDGGTINAYNWTGTPDPQNVQRPTVSLAAGSYSFTLSIVDDEGTASASTDIVHATVLHAPICGDGEINGAEQCDCAGGSCTAAGLNNQSCSSLGFFGGTLSCSSATCLFDTSVCTTAQAGTTIYVDNSISPSNCSTYNPSASEGDSRCLGGTATAYRDIQSAADTVSPGITVFIRKNSQPYQKQAGTDSCPAGQYGIGAKCFINIYKSGTAAQPIKFEGYPGERPIINGTGVYGELVDNEVLLYIHKTANYIEVRNLEVSNAAGNSKESGWGILVHGSFGKIENVISHHNNRANLDVYGKYNEVKNNEFYRACSEAGVIVHPGGQYNLFLDNLIHDNGIFEGRKTCYIHGYPPGAGFVSDGFSFNHGTCREALGTENECGFNEVRGNVLYNNTENSIDATANHNLFIENIAVGDHSGNVLIHEWEQVGDSYFIKNVFLNGLYWGIQDTPGDTFGGQPLGKVLNNLVIGMAQGGIGHQDSFACSNVSFGNSRSDTLLRGTECATGSSPGANWWQTKSVGVDPQLADSAHPISFNYPAGMEIAQKVQFIKGQVRQYFSPRAGSPLIDSGLDFSFTNPRTGQTETIGHNERGPFEYFG